MKPILIAAVTIVNIALLTYSIGIITEQRKHRVTGAVVTFLSIGVICDIAATICMILGSESSPFSPHGFLGYSSLIGMVIDTILIWRFRLLYGALAEVPRRLHLYSRIAYSWWLVAYISGGLLVALR